MIDHITIRVSDFEKSKVFYTQVLECLGYSLAEKAIGQHGQKVAGFCASNKRDFWLTEAGAGKGNKSFSCLAFGASSKKTVDIFYDQALKAGGIDNGKPNYRPEYHPGYYAAFVLDPDGNNIEAVFDDWAKASSKT